jgi:hypothetical protein
MSFPTILVSVSMAAAASLVVATISSLAKQARRKRNETATHRNPGTPAMTQAQRKPAHA